MHRNWRPNPPDGRRGTTARPWHAPGYHEPFLAEKDRLRPLRSNTRKMAGKRTSAKPQFGCRQVRVLVGPEHGDQIGIPASRLAAKRRIGGIEKVEDSFERQIGRGKVLPAQVDSIE